MQIKYKNIQDLSIPENSPIFFSQKWISFIEDTFKFDIKIISFYQNNKPVAFIPLIISHKYRILGSPIKGTFTPYMGLFTLTKLDEESEKALANSLYNFLDKEYRFFLNKRFVFFQHYNSLKTDKYFSTYEVEIQKNEEEMWKYISSRCRNMIRKAEKNNVSVVEIEPSNKYINMYYDMLIDTFSRRGAKPFHSRDVFFKLFKHLYPENIKFLATEVNGKIASMGIFLFNKYHLYFLSGASNPEYNKYAVNNKLHWEVLKFSMNNNIHLYDMGGKGIPSIDKFKESFGGKVKKYQILEYESGLYRLGLKIYKILRGIK